MNNMGDRVFAVQSATKESVRLFGRGVYRGDIACPILFDIPNPCIELDDGKGTVWGCECWWGPESRFDEFVSGREVTVVAVPDRSPQTTSGLTP